MPALALSRVGARVVEYGPGGQVLAAGAWQRLKALPDPRSPRGRIYPLACLIAIAVCAFTAGTRPGRDSYAEDRAICTSPKAAAITPLPPRPSASTDSINDS